ncbi:MAG: proline--tRNA ligase, partial [Parcubacteria group bacterium]|nr:proline--tRNA ligase [Parcubacteria group bacterium]
FKKTGVVNAYFPLFIAKSFLVKVYEHVEGFSPELAIVTIAGGKELKEPLVVRPTSETIIYEAYSRWIQSHRDLPLLINQWANIVRWELRPRLFLRTTEFLWQEGHTAHATAEEAEERTKMMVNIYKEFSEKYLAIPVIAGVKSESEKFAGALRTYTIEAMMQDGKALQFATSHNLGQNFAKPFDVKFLDENGESKFVWQTSWGLSTRSIGGIIMTHGDDKGLVLPPMIAPVQVVIICIFTGYEADKEVLEKAEEIKGELEKNGVRVKIDKRDKRLGEKSYEWERKGVPIRIEIGPKDITNDSVILVRRDTGSKEAIKINEIVNKVKGLLEKIQNKLFDKALKLREDKTKIVDSYDDFKKTIENNNFVLAHWDGTAETEEKIKQETKATIRCIPFDSKEEQGKCVYSGKQSDKRVLFAKAY